MLIRAESTVTLKLHFTKQGRKPMGEKILLLELTFNGQTFPAVRCYQDHSRNVFFQKGFNTFVRDSSYLWKYCLVNMNCLNDGVISRR